MAQAIKALAKSGLRWLLPEPWWVAWISERSRRHQAKWLAENGFEDLNHRFLKDNEPVVAGGPFRGMRYPKGALKGRHVLPRLLGCYEAELHEVVEGVIADPSIVQMIEIGTAEGYYAIGMAMRMRRNVIGFETSKTERAHCREMAEINKVSQLVTLRNWCDGSALRTALDGKRSFVLSDCEGYEAVLFDDETVASLAMSDVLIELHPTPGDNLEASLRRCFERTHIINHYDLGSRSPEMFAESALAGDLAAMAVVELRENQRWLWCRAKSKG